MVYRCLEPEREGTFNSKHDSMHLSHSITEITQGLEEYLFFKGGGPLYISGLTFPGPDNLQAPAVGPP